MLLRELSVWAQTQLPPSDSRALDVLLLLHFVIQKPKLHCIEDARTWFYLNENLSIPESLQQQFQQLLWRRQQGEPLAYLRGFVEFWDFRLIVNEHVLIPRADTELLIEAALTYITQRALPQPRILELGTGSGAIALALAKTFPHALITATDVNPEALAVAKQNARLLHCETIEFVCSDWWEGLSGSWDLVVSNPPYIDLQDPHLEDDVKKFEPHLALFAEQKGFAAFEKILKHLPLHLASTGAVFFEHGFMQAAAVREALIKLDLQTKTFCDLAGLDRVTQGWQSHG